uniref:Sushi domain-containing protein n=1 Tax=Sinocyclocheilus rhinocerous TaxID=307959 RepID=A0A673J6U8_9TELE
MAALFWAHAGQCAPLLSPAVGTLKLVSGDGTSMGSVMSLQCPSRHRAVGGSQMSCVWSSNKTHWSGGTPECKPLSRFEDDGFRLALLVSFSSLAIILVMSIIFITFCLVRHVKREESILYTLGLCEKQAHISAVYYRCYTLSPKPSIQMLSANPSGHD